MIEKEHICHRHVRMSDMKMRIESKFKINSYYIYRDGASVEEKEYYEHLSEYRIFDVLYGKILQDINQAKGMVATHRSMGDCGDLGEINDILMFLNEMSNTIENSLK